jgi:hypothetical protein
MNNQEQLNPFVGGKERPVTDEQKFRGNYLGFTAERLQQLLRAGTEYEFDANGKRIEIAPTPTDPNVVVNRENHHMIKPDPRGIFYLKVTIAGKTIVKPLAKDAETSRVMRDKHLKALNYVPSRHSARQ